MGDQPFEPSVREFDFPDDTVYRIASVPGVDIVRIPKRLAQEHEAEMENTMRLARERLQVIRNESENMFKYVCHTEMVVNRMGCQFFCFPQNAVIALSRMSNNDWAFLGKLFAIEVTIGHPEDTKPFPELLMELQELHELHKRILVAYANDDVEEGEGAWELARLVYDSLVADLIVIQGILNRHAVVYSENRLAMIGPDEGIPIGVQKELLPGKVARIEQWVVGLPSNQSMLECDCSAAQIYDDSMIVPPGGFTADQFLLYLWKSDAMKAKDLRDEAEQVELPAETYPEHATGEFSLDEFIDPSLLTLPRSDAT